MNIIYRWKSQLLTTVRLLRKVAALDWFSLTTEKRDVSSTKRFQFEDTPFNKSLIQIRNDNGPKTEPWGTPAVAFSQDESCPFRTTSCLWQYGKSRKSLKCFQRYHLRIFWQVILHDILYQKPLIYLRKLPYFKSVIKRLIYFVSNIN